MADTQTTTGHYIFRIHDDGASDIRLEDWAHSSRLDAGKIRTIRDVLKKGAAKIATSVPSPFARMHLFDTAFRMVADELQGDSVYHQLVSDCLDVFQLLFSSGNKGALKYRSWDRAERIARLRGAGEGHPHKLLADSLELFFNGKFAGMQQITLLYYKGILLGGTSPLTLFFTSPNWQREMSENGIHISSATNNDEFFDMDFRPLHERDALFVEFMYRYYLAYRGQLHAQCEGLATYIRNTIEHYRKDLVRKVADEWKDYVNNPAALERDYQRVEVVPNDNIHLQAGGMYIYTVRTGDIPSKIESDSDFVIQPTVEHYRGLPDPETGARLAFRPLVLARGMNINGTYTYDRTPWNPATDIRRSSILDTFGRPVPLTQRYLPGNAGIRYPFLTAEDFLEDTLIRMPYRLHREQFFTGYDGDFQYLLPVRKEYFNFFTVDDLKDGLTITPGDGKITVQLRIPVRNTQGTAHVLFTREYDLQAQPALTCNAGIAIAPFYQITDPEEQFRALNEYTVLLVDNNDQAAITELAFWRTEDIAHERQLNVPRPEARTYMSREGSSYFYQPGSAFDIMELKMKDSSRQAYTGLILPKFRRIANRQATRAYTFAIDFGTSNSHIACLEQSAGRKPVPFTIGPDELQTVLLNAPGDGATAAERYSNGFGSFPELKAFVNREALPVIIGSNYGSAVAFPIRTATAEKKTFAAEPPALFRNISIGFSIDTDPANPDSCVFQTNLKWLFENGRNPSDTDRIEAFLKELLWMIRNKVVTTGGRLEDTRIVWLRPLSMRQRSVDLFADRWKSAFGQVFGQSGAMLLGPVAESVAPYFYLKSNPVANIMDFADAINTDIGGGTTDVMFFMRRTGKYMSTSFRFAGNDIWGDGINRNEKDNGFIRNFLAFQAESRRGRQEEDSILQKFLEDPALTSEDVISLLFRYDSHFRFSDSVSRQNPQLKLVLFLHYSAIIYHIVQLIEQEDLNIPRYFTFTGKGSRYLELMSAADALTRFTKMLLAAYTQRPVPADFRVVLIDQPKEATANGATLFVSSHERDSIQSDAIEVVSHWGAAPGYPSEFRRNVTPLKAVYNDQSFREAVLRNLQHFVERTLGDEQIAVFLAEYEIKSLGDYMQWLTGGDVTQSGQLYDSFHSCLENMRSGENDGISDTFFFLALKNTLYTLSREIVARTS